MNLGQYLAEEKIKPASFAATLGVPASTVARWVSRARVPRLEWLAKIEEATKGQVTASDFMAVQQTYTAQNQVAAK